MERKINYLSICYTLFLIMIFISGSIGGYGSDVVYYLAFLLPIILGLLLDKQEVSNDAELFSVKSKDVGLMLPMIVPTVLIVMAISAVTSMIIFALSGAENKVDVGDFLVPALISHALLPAILEEALFRYLPMRLLLKDSKRLTVILSALFFAFAHHNLFSIPYAFVAGIIFMAIDVGTESIIPSVVIHFINNAISVGMLVYEDNAAFTPTLLILLAILFVISVAYIIRKKETYLKLIRRVFEKDVKIIYTLPMKIFVFISLFVAILSLM